MGKRQLSAKYEARVALLEKIAVLATELCVCIDLAEADVGGCRSALTVLQELGPLTSELEKLN